MQLPKINLKEGETIYITGLISEEERKETVSIPVLGTIPVVGRLFRKDKNEPIQSEIIMAIRVSKHKNYDIKDYEIADTGDYEKEYWKYYERLNLMSNIEKRKKKGAKK